MSSAIPADSAAGGLLPIDLDGIDPAVARPWLRTMLLIREFESRLDALSMGGKVIGGVHLSIGQEAVAVGIVAGLERQDLVACGHRSHHHAIARGMPARGIMAELYGRADGCRGGRGGTMHLSDMNLGFLGGNGIVGAGLGVAMGAALAARLRRRDQVSVGIFGEGGANTGRTWESINLAVALRLPLIAVCENNLYAVETPSASLTGGVSIAARASGFGLPSHQVDGQDVAAVARVAGEARRRAASGEGPTFIEALTYRYEGHSTGQVINYRTAEEVQRWRDTRDPIARLRLALMSSGGLTEQEHEALVADVKSEVEEAIAFAEASPLPDPSEATRGVTALDLEAWGH